MTFEPAQTYHGDQEKVRGRDLLEVFWVSVSEPFDVNQSQHHCAWRDTRFPGEVNNTNKFNFLLWGCAYMVGHPASDTNCTDLETWAAYFLWSLRMGLGADFWKNSTAMSARGKQKTHQRTTLSRLELSVRQGGQSSPVTGQERASRDTSWSRP